MRKFQTVIFVLAMVIASTQSFRHIYVKWVASTGSVLDQFQSETESNISVAKSLEELVPLYAEAKSQVEKYESNATSPQIENYQRSVTEPYKSELRLKEEIESRESRQKQVVELFFYWAGGLFSILAGVLVYRRVNDWLGISAMLTGLTEMIYWTSPLHIYQPGGEFELLLNAKLGLSLITLGLLVSLWLLSGRHIRVDGGTDSA